MLCQLSYRGSLGWKSLAKLALDLVERVADLGEHALELDGAREVVAGQVSQLAPDEPLLEAQEELAGDIGAQVLLLGDRPELGSGEDEVCLLHRYVPDEMGPQAPVLGVVEMAVVERPEVALHQLG